MDDFIIFILSHGRAGNIDTIKSLKKSGYTGKYIIVIDNEDSQISEYLNTYENVEIFDKEAIAKTFDEADNFKDRRAVVYARNACFEIAKKLGYKYFMQLDDDYTRFDYRIYSNNNQKPKQVKNLDSVVLSLLDFYKNSHFSTLSIAQGGDYIGGKRNKNAVKPTLSRKCMNSFICSTERPFKFQGRINEDVNTYVSSASKGLLMGTIPMVSLTQKTTQKNKGGMTSLYLDSGTYIKSFYTVIFSPSCVHISLMGDKHLRYHHSVKWDSAVPKIIKEDLKK